MALASPYDYLRRANEFVPRQDRRGDPLFMHAFDRMSQALIAEVDRLMALYQEECLKTDYELCGLAATHGIPMMLNERLVKELVFVYAGPRAKPTSTGCARPATPSTPTTRQSPGDHPARGEGPLARRCGGVRLGPLEQHRRRLGPTPPGDRPRDRRPGGGDQPQARAGDPGPHRRDVGAPHRRDGALHQCQVRGVADRSPPCGQSSSWS